MRQEELLLEQLKAGKAGKNHAAVTILHAEGSTPRSSGKMLVFADGKTIGTIGGGEVERLAAEDARKALQEGGNLCKEYRLTPDKNGIGMTCGGSVTVFIEVYLAKPRLIMCGAGHVGGALISLAQFCGFEVTLLDTRPDEYIQDKIDLADRYIHAENFYDGLMQIEISAPAYIVIATFGHSGDGEALDAALQKESAYIGMVGSKKKIAALFEKLRAKGYSDAQLQKVYTPVGLDIGSETPEEIALSIMAEIMMVKKGGSAKHLRDCEHK